jgi:S-adenosylmethionine uptake transporter
MDACIKSVTPHYHTLQIAFLRFGMGSIYAAIVFAAMRPTWPTVESVRVNALRSLLAVVTACAFFFALSRLEMAEAMALSFVSPLFIALFGVVLLKERFDARLAAALAAGVAGMTVIMSGKVGGSGFSLDAWVGVAAVLVSAVCYALVVVLLRARAKVDPLPTIVLFQNVGPALLLAGPAYYVWTAPTAAHLALFVGVGALGVAGHTLLANAFARAEAARLAPVHYVVLLWGILFGWLFFGEIPGLTTLFGAALIVVATLLTQRR